MFGRHVSSKGSAVGNDRVMVCPVKKAKQRLQCGQCVCVCVA